MRVTSRGAAWLLCPGLALMAVLYVAPLAIYFTNGFHRFQDGRILPVWTVRTFLDFFSDPFSYKVIGTSVRLAVIVTALALLIGYPVAYALHTRVARPGARALLAVLLFSPLVVSVVVRTYGWFILLANQGMINSALRWAGVTAAPVSLLFNLVGVVISLTHILLPFAIFPIYSVLGRLDPTVKEASRDLGAGWWETFTRVTLPLSAPGVVAATQICFTLALSAFVTPQLLGGGRVQVLPLTVYNSTVEVNWPAGAVAGITLLGLSMVAISALNRAMRRLPSA